MHNLVIYLSDVLLSSFSSVHPESDDIYQVFKNTN